MTQKEELLVKLDNMPDEAVDSLLATVQYESYVPGLSFSCFRRELSRESWSFHEKSRGLDYMFVTRHTVLGRMRETKQKLFEEWRHLLEALSSEEKKQLLKLLLQGVELQEACWTLGWDGAGRKPMDDTSEDLSDIPF